MRWVFVPASPWDRPTATNAGVERRAPHDDEGGTTKVTVIARKMFAARRLRVVRGPRM